MLIHYCVIAFKNIWKYKISASISILGLAFALVCFVPILYWMDHETTYDSFYKDSESIYRVYSAEKQSGKVNKGASKGIENSLREQVPAIEASTTLMLSTENCRTQATPYIQMNMLYTDSTFLEVFPQSFVCGEMNHPLQIVNNMILSERTAVRLFGDAEKAIGQPIHTLMRASLPPYIVTAVVKDPSPHTNLPFDAIINHNMIQHFSQLPPEAQWSFFVMDLYVKLHPSSDPKAFANQLKELPERCTLYLKFHRLVCRIWCPIIVCRPLQFLEFLYGSLSATCAGMAFTDGQRRNEKAIDRTNVCRARLFRTCILVGSLDLHSPSQAAFRPMAGD